MREFPDIHMQWTPFECAQRVCVLTRHDVDSTADRSERSIHKGVVELDAGAGPDDTVAWQPFAAQ
jgi:hypothetical protein